MKKNFFSSQNQDREDLEGSKIIFLDIDGVIYIGAPYDKEHMTQPYLATVTQNPIIREIIPHSVIDSLDEADISASLNFDKKALSNVHYLCEKYNAKIVITSSWRKTNTLEQLKALFTICAYANLLDKSIPSDTVDFLKSFCQLYNIAEYIIDCTLILDDKRGEEIEKWKEGKNIQSFVIVDDCPFDFEKRFPNNFICCHRLFSDPRLYDEAVNIIRPSLHREYSSISK